jgi:hypothetical protein
MGLDQFAYAAARAGQQDEYWGDYDPRTDVSTISKPREIAYWRKHPNLQGWMERLWQRKIKPAEDLLFNGVELELTWEDIEALEAAILEGQLPHTEGFFFGDPSDDYYREQDLKFVKDAKADLFVGLKVFYNSSW